MQSQAFQRLTPTSPRSTRTPQTNTQTPTHSTRNSAKRNGTSETKPLPNHFRLNFKIQTQETTRPKRKDVRNKKYFFSKIFDVRFNRSDGRVTLHPIDPAWFWSESSNPWLQNARYIIPNAQTKPKVWSHRLYAILFSFCCYEYAAHACPFNFLSCYFLLFQRSISYSYVVVLVVSVTVSVTVIVPMSFQVF